MDELGSTTTYTYDGLNRILTKKDPLNRTTTFSYLTGSPANAGPTLVTLPSGRQVAASYTAAWGYTTLSITTAYGTSSAATTTYGHDANGNVNSVTDPLNHATTFGYDARNRKSWAQNAAGNESMFYYDDASNLTSQVTPDGTATITYDTMNRPVSLNDAKNQTSSSTYDAEGKLHTYTDPKSNVYTYAYDLDEHSLSTQYPDSTTQTATYDGVGNVLTAKGRDGTVQTLAYDNRNRNTGRSWNDGITPAVTAGYDNASRVTSLSNTNSALGYTYDNDSEVLSETQNVTGLGSKTVGYTYTTDGTLNTLTNPDNTVLTYGYDNANNLTSIVQGSTTVVSYSYDANNNRIGKSLANGVTSTLTYDNVERLTSITNLTPSPTAGTLLEKFQYGYDALSRRTYVKRDNAQGDVYGYDTADQLTSVQYGCTNPDTAPASPVQTVSYTFDAAGNRTQVVDSLNGTTNYTPNANNQYSSMGSSTVTYDTKGNLTSLNGCNYTYNANNQLITYSDQFFNAVSQTYDALGRCVKRVENGTTSYFIYDLSWNLIADFSSAGSQLYRYVRGPGSNEIVSRTDSSSNVVYYHTDGAGSVTKLTSSTGALNEQYSYDVYGQVTIKNALGTILTASGFANRFLFTGAEFVASLGLLNFRNRFYSPKLGRFLQPDPIGHLGDSYNIYRYCGNSPNNMIDPAGLDNELTFSGSSQDFSTGSWTYTTYSYTTPGSSGISESFQSSSTPSTTSSSWSFSTTTYSGGNSNTSAPSYGGAPLGDDSEYTGGDGPDDSGGGSASGSSGGGGGAPTEMSSAGDTAEVRALALRFRDGGTDTSSTGVGTTGPGRLGSVTFSPGLTSLHDDRILSPNDQFRYGVAWIAFGLLDLRLAVSVLAIPGPAGLATGLILSGVALASLGYGLANMWAGENTAMSGERANEIYNGGLPIEPYGPERAPESFPEGPRP